MSKRVLRLGSSVILLAVLSTFAMASGGDPQPPTPKMPVKYPPMLRIAQ